MQGRAQAQALPPSPIPPPPPQDAQPTKAVTVQTAAPVIVQPVMSMATTTGTPVVVPSPVQSIVQTSSQPANPPSTPQAFPNGFFFISPYNNSLQNRRLLDALKLRVQLTMQYAASPNLGCKLAGSSSVENSYCLVREVAPGKTRVLELAISSLPTREREIIVYGVELASNGDTTPNPDLATLQPSLQAEIVSLTGRASAAPDLEHLSSQLYDLSYIEGDRAIGLLKAMGYTTVEYRADAGESLYDKIYSPIRTGDKAPIVVKMVSPSKTSLMEPNPQPALAPGQYAAPLLQQQATSSAVPEIGGTFLHHSTQGEPAERLLILYEPDDTESLQKILDLLREQIDVPARQVIIEAQVIEINSNRSQDLGVSFASTQSGVDVSNGGLDANGQVLPFVLNFDKNAISIAQFKAQLTAMMARGEAELLSNPSVLVLDGRQARIQIGQQVPVVKSVSTQAGIISSVDYFPVGIVLNLRPHVSDDGAEITMQTETIVSAIAQASSNTGSSAQVFLAPVVDNRQVQSFIRVSDNTPFIIGGLISTNDRKNTTGVPYLSDLPLLGNLFKRTQTSKTKQEVIIVVTPHVVPIRDKYLSYVIPKDSAALDRFNYTLFRNAYRVRAGDLFDLQFITQSKAVSDLRKRAERDAAADAQLRTTEPVSSILKGLIPGEDIFVRRMLWEIIQKTGFSSHIATDKIIFFGERPNAPDGTGYQLSFLKDKLQFPAGNNALTLTFEANPQTDLQRPFTPPIAHIATESVTRESFITRLSTENARDALGARKNNGIILSDQYSGLRVSPLDVLKGVLVLKRVLELNRSMPLTIPEFHVGRQIVFPTDEDLAQHYHIVDREAAQFFYEVVSYYPAFEQEFSQKSKRAVSLLEQVEK